MTNSIYEMQVMEQLKKWERELLKPPGLMEKTSKLMQNRVNDMLPQKVHDTITATVKGIVQSTLFSLDYLPKNEPLLGASLSESDAKSEQLLAFYKKLAAAEGAGTGAGGIFLALADFPILIGIKLKFLFELSHAYGFSARNMEERLFILNVFQLAFSGQTKKKALLNKIKNWEHQASLFRETGSYAEQLDWQQLQQEYRDTIDFRKMLQLIPGIGAVVGAWANYGLLEELGQVGRNCFRLRKLNEPL